MRTICVAAALSAAVFIDFSPAEENLELKISQPSVTLFHEFGNIVRGVEFESISFEDYWVQRTGGFISVSAKRNDRLALDLILGGIYWNPTFNENGSSESVLRYFAGSAPKVNVSYIWGEIDQPTLRVDGGIFPYKYNDYARNLGEYAFRTSAYPGLVYTGGLTSVDVNKPSVTGLKFTHNWGSIFSHDLLITTETEMIPHYDINLTYMARANFGGVLKLAAGVQFARLLPIRPSATNPDIKFNRYFTFKGTTYVDNPDYYAQLIKGAKPGQDTMAYHQGFVLADSLAKLGAITADSTLPMSKALAKLDSVYGTSGSTYDHFHTSSIKPVVSASFDPKPLFGGVDVMGAKDLVLYGEATVLGVQDQPVLYGKLSERIVAMAGFNVPTFRLLETLTFELEHNSSIYPNASQYNQRDIGRQGSVFQTPAWPSISNTNLLHGYNPADWKKDDWRWSVFASRDILKGLSLAGQVASDNARGFVYPSGRRYWALYRDPAKDWYWMLKLTAKI